MSGNKVSIDDDGRIIVEQGHLGLMTKSKCSTRKILASYGQKEVELQHE